MSALQSEVSQSAWKHAQVFGSWAPQCCPLGMLSISRTHRSSMQGVFLAAMNCRHNSSPPAETNLLLFCLLWQLQAALLLLLPLCPRCCSCSSEGTALCLGAVLCSAHLPHCESCLKAEAELYGVPGQVGFIQPSWSPWEKQQCWELHVGPGGTLRLCSVCRNRYGHPAGFPAELLQVCCLKTFQNHLQLSTPKHHLQPLQAIPLQIEQPDIFQCMQGMLFIL